jgi:hypothetical protein
MGYRVLRTEAACSVGMGIVFSRYGLFWNVIGLFLDFSAVIQLQ